MPPGGARVMMSFPAGDSPDLRRDRGRAPAPVRWPSRRGRSRSHGFAAAAVVLLVVPVVALTFWSRTPQVGRMSVDMEPPTVPAVSASELPAESPPSPFSPQAELDAAVPARAPAADDVAPPPVAAVAPTEGRLVVMTEPAGAIVTVNGIGHGATPVTIRYLPLGEQRVRVTMPGYRSEERRVRLASSQPSTTVRLTLRPWN
jgi:hypothetical protein